MSKTKTKNNVKTVKIGEARDNLSKLLRYVRKGGRVRILDRDMPVAEIVPVPPANDESPEDDDAYLEWAIAHGKLERPKEPGGFPLELLDEPLIKGTASVVEALLEERRSGM